MPTNEQKIPVIVTTGFQIRSRPGVAADEYRTGDRLSLTPEQFEQYRAAVRPVAEVEAEEQAREQEHQAAEAQRKAAEEQEKLVAGLKARSMGLGSQSYADAVEAARLRYAGPIELRRRQLQGRAPWPEAEALKAPPLERLTATDPIYSGPRPGDMSQVLHMTMQPPIDLAQDQDLSGHVAAGPQAPLPLGAQAIIEATPGYHDLVAQRRAERNPMPPSMGDIAVTNRR